MPLLSPPPGQSWPGQAVPIRRSSGRHGAAPLPPPLPARHPGERIISVHDKIAGTVPPPRVPTHSTIPTPTPAAREPLPTWQGELRRLAATQLFRFRRVRDRACSRPVGRACMAPCHRIRMIRGGILAYSASYARGCACLAAVVAWCGARAPRPRIRMEHALSMPGG